LVRWQASEHLSANRVNRKMVTISTRHERRRKKSIPGKAKSKAVTGSSPAGKRLPAVELVVATVRGQ
jgi:hypothetical protein